MGDYKNKSDHKIKKLSQCSCSRRMHIFEIYFREQGREWNKKNTNLEKNFHSGGNRRTTTYNTGYGCLSHIVKFKGNAKFNS